MEPSETSPQEKHPHISDEMKRAKYWANLLDKAIYKYDIYIIAKSNLDSTNKNSIKQEKSRKLLEKAIRRYEEVYNRRSLID
jgi:hypothetical protein